MSYIINQNVEKLFTYYFLRDIHEGYQSLDDADDEQSNFAAKLNSLDKGKKQLKNSFF